MSSHSTLRGLVLQRWDRCTSVEFKTTGPGEVEVTVVPRWLEYEVIRYLNRSDMTPVGVLFTGGTPMTNFNLTPGLTLISGQVGTGKTSMLLCVGGELFEEGAAVLGQFAEGIPHGLMGKYQPRFACNEVRDITEVERALQETPEGGALLVDMIELLIEKPKNTVAGGTRTLLDICQRLNLEARERKVYLVFSIQTRRNPTGMSGTLQSGLVHSFPILECLA